MKKPFISVMFLIALGVSSVGLGHAHAQVKEDVQCGGEYQLEFTQLKETQVLSLPLEPGDQVQVSARGIGKTLRFGMVLIDPIGTLVTMAASASSAPTMGIDEISGRGVHGIYLANHTDYVVGNTGAWFQNAQGVGVYSLKIECMRDGKPVTGASSSVKNTPTPVSQPALPTPVSASLAGPGWRGSGPVSLSDVETTPLVAGESMQGQLTVKGNAVIAYSLVAKQGDRLDVSYRRRSGNLNLGLILLAPNGSLAFQSSLMSLPDSQFRLPIQSSGTYTLAFYRMDGDVTGTPTAISFQLLVQLNPK